MVDKHQLGVGGYAYLVTPHLLRHMIQRLYNPQPQLLPLLILCDRNILNMPYQPQTVDEFTLDEDRASADDFARVIGDTEKEVFVISVRDPLISLIPLLPISLLAPASL